MKKNGDFRRALSQRD